MREELTILTPGARLGAYEIVARVGRGGFGEVYKARDTRLDRSVAIKLLPSTDPELRGRFDREARAIAALQHPHICALHDIGQHDGVGYLVLEFLEGETLASRIARGPLPIHEALTIAIAIASALDRAHAAGFVHRDLKPENVMLTRGGPKLLDFGLAKLRRPDPGLGGVSAVATGPVVTAEGHLVGTLHYMSPEQINGAEADTRSDIWAFGCVLYEMLTGRKAFEVHGPASVIAAIMSGVPRPPGTRSPLTPPVVDRIVATCLALDPDRRFQSAHDLGLQLQWIADGSQIDRPAPGGWRYARYAPWAIAAAAALVAIGVLLRDPSPGAGDTQRPVSFLVDAPDGSPFPIAPMFLTVSPDGSSLAFVAGEVSGGQRLFVRALNSTEARPLQGTEDVDQPFWSPDSRSIAFVDRVGSKLMRIDVAGGPPRAIADLPRGQTLQGGTWNQNGDIVFGLIGGGNPIYHVPAAGGQPTPLTTLDRANGELAHIWPHFLPDGDHFLYAVPSSRADRGGIHLARLTAPGATRVVDTMSNVTYVDPGFLLFIRDETLLAQRFDTTRLVLVDEPFVVATGMGTGAGNGRAAFAASRNGVLAYRPQSGGVYATTLTWFDRSGRELGTVGSPNLHRAIAVSPDGARVAAQIGWTVGADIWVAEVGRGIFTRVTSDPNNEEWPVWSPDGGRIAFASNRDRNVFNIYDMPADGSAPPRLLVESDSSQRPVQWSRDGQWLLIDGDGVMALRLDGSSRQVRIGTERHPAEFAKISPDGQWVAYATRENGRFEIFLQQFPVATGRWPISSAGGTRPHWRGDGRELYYVSLDNQLQAVALTLGAPPVIGAARTLFPIRVTSAQSGAGVFDGIEVSEDGQRFLVNLAAEATSPQPITVRIDWLPDPAP